MDTATSYTKISSEGGLDAASAVGVGVSPSYLRDFLGGQSALALADIKNRDDLRLTDPELTRQFDLDPMTHSALRDAPSYLGAVCVSQIANDRLGRVVDVVETPRLSPNDHVDARGTDVELASESGGQTEHQPTHFNAPMDFTDLFLSQDRRPSEPDVFGFSDGFKVAGVDTGRVLAPMVQDQIVGNRSVDRLPEDDMRHAGLAGLDVTHLPVTSLGSGHRPFPAGRRESTVNDRVPLDNDVLLGEFGNVQWGTHLQVLSEGAALPVVPATREFSVPQIIPGIPS